MRLYGGRGESLSDPRADVMERVYNEYADLMYRIALTYMHNREDAEDAVHDAFISYIRKAPRFFDVERERAWICRVTVNKCRDALRRRAIRQHSSLDDEAALSVPSQEDELPAELRDLLDKLPEKLRLVTVLHYLEGFSVSEVAAITGTTASAVKMRLSRARNLLKETYGGEVI